MNDETAIAVTDAEEVIVTLDMIQSEDCPINIAEAYENKTLPAIVDAIRKDVMSEAPDMTTTKGRDRVKSLAYKVSRTKTFLDDYGKDMTEDMRTAIKAVDAERKTMRDSMDAIRDDVRAPLTLWEEQEAERKAKHQAVVDEIDALDANWRDDPADIRAKLDRLAEIQIDEALQEYEVKAADARTRAKDRLEVTLENAELRVRQAEDMERERAARAKAEAELAEAEKQRKEAEAKAEAERAEAEAKAEAERAAHKAEMDRAARENQRKTHAIMIISTIKDLERDVITESITAQNAMDALRSIEISKNELGDHYDQTHAVFTGVVDRVKAALPQPTAKPDVSVPDDNANSDIDSTPAEPTEDDKRQAALSEISAAISKIKKADIPQALIDGQIPHVTVAW
jgi:uncharacterized membrane protein YqiK